MGLRCNKTIILTGFYSRRDYPEVLRRISFRNRETKKLDVFLTNNFSEPALKIAQLYRCRWNIELFFKWIKQHLRINAFYGTSENAVRAQV
jgi:IS4 transposase